MPDTLHVLWNGSSDNYQTPVRVVRVRETWTQREQKGPEWMQHQKEQNWMCGKGVKP